MDDLGQKQPKQIKADMFTLLKLALLADPNSIKCGPTSSNKGTFYFCGCYICVWWQ